MKLYYWYMFSCGFVLLLYSILTYTGSVHALTQPFCLHKALHRGQVSPLMLFFWYTELSGLSLFFWLIWSCSTVAWKYWPKPLNWSPLALLVEKCWPSKWNDFQTHNIAWYYQPLNTAQIGFRTEIWFVYFFCV